MKWSYLGKWRMFTTKLMHSETKSVEQFKKNSKLHIKRVN